MCRWRLQDMTQCKFAWKTTPPSAIFHLASMKMVTKMKVGPYPYRSPFPLGMYIIYIKECMYTFSNIYLPGKCSYSWVLQRVIQVSSMESKRKLVVPERCPVGFWQNWMSNGYIKKATYKFSDLYLPGKCSISYVSPEHHHGVQEDAGGSWEESW